MKTVYNRLFIAISVLIPLSLGCGLAGRTAVPPTAILLAEATPPGATLAPAATPTHTPLPSPTLSATPTPLPPTATPDATPTHAEAASAGPRVLWRAGGKNVFTTLGGLDTDGERIYVADAYQGALVFDLQGNLLDVLALGEMGYVVDVKVGPQGRVYMADRGLGVVALFDASGDLLGTFGVGLFAPNALCGLAIDSTGQVFALDHALNDAGRPISRVQVFDADGSPLGSLMLGAGHEWSALAVDPDDMLLAVHPDGYLAEFASENGMLIQRLGLDALRDRLPVALAVDGEGTLYVTTQIPAAVAILNLMGEWVAWLGEETVRTDEGWPEGEFLFPFGVAVSADGQYVVVGDTFESFAFITVWEMKK